MKKLMTLIILLALIFTSCGNTGDKNKEEPSPPQAVKEEVKGVDAVQESINGINGINLLYDKNMDIDYTGFNEVFLSIDGVRISKTPYRTDFNVVRKIDRSISLLEGKKVDYYINITSGPGISKKDGLYNIFYNKTEAFYFSKMVEEMISKYKGNKHFKGIALDIGDVSIPPEKYYDTMEYIITRIQYEYSDTNIVLNLHPLAFEDGLKDVPELKFENVTLNLPIAFNGISYPGYTNGINKSYEVNKNVLLSKLKAYIELTDKYKYKLKPAVSLRVPWVDGTEVLLQDMLELSKMLKFDFNISYGNSEDTFDYRTNTSVVKVIKRHSN